MNTEMIVKTARKTLDGTISFPEVVGQLFAAGVEYYHVDYVGLRKTFYSADGDAVVTPINLEGLPPVAANFNAVALCADILDSQRNSQPYRDFTRRAMEAGVQGYFTFLRGKRVTYFGRQGDAHTEWFPNSHPAPSELTTGLPIALTGQNVGAKGGNVLDRRDPVQGARSL